MEDIKTNIVSRPRYPGTEYAKLKEIKNGILELRSYGVTSHFVIPFGMTDDDIKLRKDAIFHLPPNYSLYPANEYDERQIEWLKKCLHIAGFETFNNIWSSDVDEFDPSKLIVMLYAKKKNIPEKKVDRRVLTRIEEEEDEKNVFKKVKLGQGTFGSVFTTSDKNIVVKEILFNAKKIQGTALIEYATLDMLRGEKNILQIVDMKFSKDSMDIRMMKCDTTLDKMLKNKSLSYPELQMSIMRQIAKGIYNMHKYGLRHRDLKPDNILIQSPDKVYIADFGSVDLLLEKNRPFINSVSTPLWAPPEEVYKTQSSLTYDIWSMGIIFIQILTNSYNTLFEIQDVEPDIVKNMISKYTDRAIRKSLSGQDPEIVKMVVKMMTFDENKRCDINDVLETLYPDEKFQLINRDTIIANLSKKYDAYPKNRNFVVPPPENDFITNSKIIQYQIYSGLLGEIFCAKILKTIVTKGTHISIKDEFVDKIKRMIQNLGKNMLLPSPMDYIPEKIQNNNYYLRHLDLVKTESDPYQVFVKLNMKK